MIFHWYGSTPPPAKPAAASLSVTSNCSGTWGRMNSSQRFSGLAAHVAFKKPVSRATRQAYTGPYDSWDNRIATLRFVQDIPLTDADPSFPLVKFVDDNLHRLANLPMLICWGERDFVFDRDYLSEWRNRFPKAEVHTFPEAGHYALEDAPDRIVKRVVEFLTKNPI